MTTLADVRDALEARLKTLPDIGGRVYDYIPDDVNYPAAIIRPPLIPEYRADLGEGHLEAVFPILLLVERNVDRKQLELYPFIERTGAKSIFRLIADTPGLGITGVSANPLGVDDFDTSTIGLTNLFGRTVNISVFVS